MTGISAKCSKKILYLSLEKNFNFVLREKIQKLFFEKSWLLSPKHGQNSVAGFSGRSHFCQPFLNSESEYSATWKRRDRICKRFRSPVIDSKESISPSCEVWRAGSITLFVVPARKAT
jgi:hypothetical protein